MVRKYFYLLVSFILIVSCAEEKKSSREIFEKYEGESGVMTFHLPPGLLTLFMDPEIGDELEILLKDIDKIKVISVNEDSFVAGSHLTFKEEFEETLCSNGYEDAAMFSGGEDIIKFKFRAEDNLINEFIITVHNKKSFMAIGLEGHVPVQKMIKFTQNVDPERFIEVCKESISF